MERAKYMPKDQGLKWYVENESLNIRKTIIELKEFMLENGEDEAIKQSIDRYEGQLEILDKVDNICKTRKRY